MIVPRILAIVLFAVLLVGCDHTPFITPATRITSSYEQEFPGILQMAAERDLGRVTIFVTHGMGDTEICYADRVATMIDGRSGKRPDCLANSWAVPVCLGETFAVDGEGFPPPGDEVVGPECGAPRPTTSAAFHFRRFGMLRFQDVTGRYRGRDIPVRIYSYWWQADAWKVQHPYLQEDIADREGRAPANLWLKREIINEGFSDAVLYTGTFGRVMREGMRSALCLMVQSEARSGLPTAPVQSPCADSESSRAGLRRLGASHVALLSESLGSRILFDALGDDEPGEIRGITVERIAEFLRERSPVVYMSANQLPLLGLGQLQVRRVDGAEAQSGLRAAPRESFLSRYLAPPNNRIVAFYDPNDLLGYRAGLHLQGETRNIIEVNQHYATRWFFFANPQDAHAQSFVDREARRLIVCGGYEPVGEDRLRVREPC